jgi:hypothetical protein
LQLVTGRLIDELRQPCHTVGRVRIVLHKSLVVDVLRRKVYIPGADAVKYRQNFLDVVPCHLQISTVGLTDSAAAGLLHTGPAEVALLTLHCLLGESFAQKLTDELKSLIGSCEASHAPKKSMDHSFPYIEASIDSCGDRASDKADGIIKQHLGVADMQTNRG